MSHFTVVKTELRNLNALAAAMKRLGYACREGDSAADYYGQQRAVDLAVDIPGQRPVGFVRSPETGLFELVGDWYNARISRDQFLNSIKCNYAREQVLESLTNQGIDLASVREIEEPDGAVVFEVTLDEAQVQALAAGG
jgi:hypothetical protein